MTKTDSSDCEPLLAELESLLTTFAARVDLPAEARLVTLLRADAILMARIGAISPSAPGLAPEIHAQRVSRAETPIDFVQRIYGPWLGLGLTMADIRRLDPKLYQNLRVWFCTKGKPDGLDLPNKKARIDKLIDALDIGGTADAGRVVLDRLRAAQKMPVRKARLLRTRQDP